MHQVLGPARRSGRGDVVAPNNGRRVHSPGSVAYSTPQVSRGHAAVLSGSLGTVHTPASGEEEANRDRRCRICLPEPRTGVGVGIKKSGERRCSAPCALRVRSAVVSTASRNQNFSSHGRRLVQRRGAWVVSLLSGFLRLSETYELQLEVFDTCVSQLPSPTACLAYGLRMVPLQICDMSDKLA